MRFVSFYNTDTKITPGVGIQIGDHILQVNSIPKKFPDENFPSTIASVIYGWYKGGEEWFRQISDEYLAGDYREFSIPVSGVELGCILPNPVSCRDGYAFRQHVESARRNRGVGMIPEYDRYPIFYYTNHLAIRGEGPVDFMPDHFHQLDFELEYAAVLGKSGINVTAEQADDYIFGYTIMNDWSARTLQMEEMLLNLGPAKGKDFCTTIGPTLITKDEFKSFEIAPPNGHTGIRLKLKMEARVNGIKVSEGNTGDMDWTFAEIIERASYGVNIYPTEIIGSGTVGTGCFLELNGTAKLNNPNAVPQWLKENDIVELEIEHMGILKNTIRIIDTEHSLLAKKKNPIA